MREILFRGKATTGFYARHFVFGYLVKDFWHQGDCGIHPIYKEQGGYIEVDPETVGQYTGLTDKNGKKIFEGDVVKVEGKPYEVKYMLGQFFVGINMPIAYKRFDCEVIGTIHDNPELLEGN